MSSNSTIEDRLEAVEEALAELKRKIEVPKSVPNWMDHVIGVFEDEPAFDEVIRLGQEFRSADRPDEDSES